MKKCPLVFNSDLGSAATDLDRLVSQGFEESACRDALAMAKGNIPLALQQLKEASVGDAKTTRLTWVGEVAGEWRDKDMTHSQVAGAVMGTEARALWKSPYYIRIGDYTLEKNSKNSDSVHYIMNVSSRDGQSWKLTKSLSDFYSFWVHLPFGLGLHSKLHFKTGFPLLKLNSLSLKTAVLGSFRQMTKDEIENRRILLENWMRELCLDEDCMTNAPFLASLEHFVEADKHKNAGKPSATMPLPSRGLRRSSTSDLQSWVKLPSTTITPPFPVPYSDVQASLPSKLDLEEVFGESYQDSNALAESITDKDVTIKQLAKDMSRDRVVIQGQRFQGVDSSLDELIEAGILAAQTTLDESNSLPMSKEAIAELTLRSLRQISRTESAYVSHTALSMAISLEEFPDLAIIPESLLAEPLRIHFRVDDEKKSTVSKGHVEKKAIAVSSNPASNKTGPIVIPTVNNPTVSTAHARVVNDSTVVTSPSQPSSSNPPSLPSATQVHNLAVVTSNPFDEESTTIPPSKSPLLRKSSPNNEGVKPSPLLRKETQSNLPLKPAIQKQPSQVQPSKKMPLPIPVRRSSFQAPPHPATSLTRKQHIPEIKTAQNLICDLQATTVFRFTNIMNMNCALQLRVTYCKSIKMFHTCKDGSSLTDTLYLTDCDEDIHSLLISDSTSPSSPNNSSDNKDNELCSSAIKSSPLDKNKLAFKSSKCFVILERETQTSSRDWRHDQTL